MNNLSSLRHGPGVGVALALALTLAFAPVAGAAGAQDGEGGGAPTRAEFSRLQNEVKEQRALIIQLMQADQQRYDMLLRLLQGQGGGAAALAPAPPPPSEAAAPPTATAAAAAPRRSHSSETERRASVEGKVSVNGGDLDDLYIYVDGLRGPPVRGKSIEIKQEGRQFSPRLAVVQAGTMAVFPNFDSVFHNVFSNSPRNSFDLGTYRAGDKPRAVTLTSPGVVEVFCNMHQKMSANILVLPNTLFTKVKADGTFRIENVPLGARKLVAWSPRVKVAQQKVDVSAEGAQVTFALERADGRAHMNKLGQAYGSYRD